MDFLNRLFLVIVSTTRSSLGKSKELSDADLVAQIVSTNNTLLFSILYDRYSKKVYNKCYSFSRDEDEAKDLTQDVFLKLFTKLNTFKAKSKFSTWLYAFTYNSCINYVQRDKARKMDNASDSMEDHDYYLSEMEDVTEEHLFEMRASKLKTALENIHPDDKAILLLKYQDDISIKELQTVLKVGESAVKMRLKRARIRVLDEHNKLK
jgi:RNA polymerase sigma factor (sigma-70 family)